ncbi:MAG: matrixin family metalloprotease [Myxococcales bacterium]|nr:matrixin family metalloprotease [Myxococcales bacterium]
MISQLIRRCIGSLLILCAIAGVAFGGAKSVIRLQPLGRKLTPRQIAAVKRAIIAFYAVDVEVAPRLPLPKLAYYPPRKRYRAEKILDWLAPTVPKRLRLVLAITATDISTSKPPHKDWGVLGLATLDGRVSVISLFRCRRRARSVRHALVRLMKVAVHEVGHNLGLDHCPHRGCLMEDGHGSVLTTDRERDLCPSCRRALERRGYRLPAPPKEIWSER